MGRTLRSKHQKQLRNTAARSASDQRPTHKTSIANSKKAKKKKMARA